MLATEESIKSITSCPYTDIRKFTYDSACPRIGLRELCSKSSPLFYSKFPQKLNLIIIPNRQQYFV